jgi:uncharacterized protein
VNLIGLEEHFVTPEVLDAWRQLDPQWQDLSLAPSTKGESARRLADLGDERLRQMDQTGLDGLHRGPDRDRVPAPLRHPMWS